MVAKYNNLVGIAVAVETKDWDILATKEFKGRYESPYGLCAEHCFQSISSYAKTLQSNGGVALVFAEHPKYQRQ
ncbi:MAG: hypothetical protein JO012_23310 [Hyphomicrobiales bacterium]|nr:hypothetical protein [Hyphomicrobiales bacterium]